MRLNGVTSAKARSIILSARQAWNAARLRATVEDLVMQMLFWSALCYDSNICVNLRSSAVEFSWLRVPYR